MIVIDASVCVKWFLEREEKDRDIALEIQKNHLGGEEIIAVPELFFIEITNVLLTKAGIPLLKTREVNALLFEMNLYIFPIDKKLLDLALNLGSAKRITVYDALYMAVSITTSAPFVTADKKLYRQINDLPSTLLSEYKNTTYA